MDGLLDFSFNVHRLLVKDFDSLPVDLMAGFGLRMLFVFGVHPVSLIR